MPLDIGRTRKKERTVCVGERLQEILLTIHEKQQLKDYFGTTSILAFWQVGDNLLSIS